MASCEVGVPYQSWLSPTRWSCESRYVSTPFSKFVIQ